MLLGGSDLEELSLALGDRGGGRAVLGLADPDQAESGEQEGEPEPGEQTGDGQTQLQGGVGDGADAELTDQAVCGAGPGLLRAMPSMGCSRSKSVQYLPSTSNS